MNTTAASFDVYRAISDRSRRSILDLLLGGEMPVRDLLASFTFSQPALSKHLRILREVGLVSQRKVGREQLYRVEADGLREVAGWVGHYQRFWTNKLDGLGAYLEEHD